MICDPAVQKPDLLKDKFWDEIIPQEMLYSGVSSCSGKVTLPLYSPCLPTPPARLLVQVLEPEFRGSAEVALEDKLDQSDKL